MEWPELFLRQNAEDPEWLAGLPALIAEVAEHWEVQLQAHFPNIEYNFVAPGTMADGTACVFKLSRHLADTRNEIAALRLYAGDGACGLLAADENRGALLLERLLPGTMLTELAERDDDEATRVAASLLRRLWRPAAEGDGLRTLASWFDAFDRNRAAPSGGVPGFPEALFGEADELRADLLATTSGAVALHGDMHHFNVLRAQQDHWLVIDPKGLLGDRHFDVYQFLGNPNDRPIPFDVQRRRLDIFCDELGLQPRRAREWCFVTAVLNACWEYEDGRPWAAAVQRAEQVRGL